MGAKRVAKNVNATVPDIGSVGNPSYKPLDDFLSKGITRIIQ